MKVTLENYQQLAERTSATADEKGRLECIDHIRQSEIRLLHGAMGLCTEAGELQDNLKRHIFYGAELDRKNIMEECGDVLWYVAEICNALGITIEDVMQRNIDKLEARYPEKFSSERALNRDLEKEQQALGYFDKPKSVICPRCGRAYIAYCGADETACPKCIMDDGWFA